jgi:hypothetical protein
MTKINPIDYHYHSILKDAVINPTKAYFFNSWNCLNPSECREYAVAILRKKFHYSDNMLKNLLKKASE